jgi:penicillin-binding protein 2
MSKVLHRILYAGFAVLAFVLFQYQMVNGTVFYRKANENVIRLIPLEAPRGLIFDRNGVPLIRNKLLYDISVFTEGEKDKERKLRAAAAILSVSYEELVRNHRRNYVAPFVPTAIYSTDDKDLILSIGDRLPEGIMITLRARRSVIRPEEYAHVVGYVNKPSPKHLYLKEYGYGWREDIGYSGVEYQYNDYLRGVAGGMQAEVNARGRIINVIGEQLPQKGKDVYLTIDDRMQRIAYSHMKSYRGSLILMDLTDGGILAMVSTPSFDVNRYRDSSEYLSSVFKDKNLPTLNRPLQGAYPPGSIFKPVVALGALEGKKIDGKTQFLCPGVFHVGRAQFKCWSTHDWENVEDSLTHSCNVFYYTTGLRLGVEKIHDYALICGLGAKTGIDLPFEVEGTVPSTAWKRKVMRQPWYGGETVNFSIGQGYLLVTPIQAVRLMGFFATGGELITPRIARLIGNVPANYDQRSRYAADSRAMSLIRKGLRGVVGRSDGTSHDLDKLKLGIAGKTGTAQVSGKKSHGWFAGYFPHDAPRFVILVMLENIGTSHIAVDVTNAYLKQLKEEGLLGTDR